MMKVELQFSMVGECLTEKVKYAQRSKGTESGSDAETPENPDACSRHSRESQTQTARGRTGVVCRAQEAADWAGESKILDPS